MRFLCDEMLERLGRWLRAAGYDAATAPRGAADRALLAQARRERRRLLTRDRGLLGHRGAREAALLLTGETLDACAAELTERLGVDWGRDPFSRCLICNVPVERAGPEIGIPPGARGVLYRCPCCGRRYWAGGHAARMRERLEGWRRPVRGP